MSKYEKRKYNVFEHIPIVFRAALGFLTLKSLKKEESDELQVKRKNHACCY